MDIGNLNGYLMSKDTVLAEIKNGELNVLNHQLLPLLLKRVNSIEVWLRNRAMDRHRPSSRILRKMLRLMTSDDITTVLKFNAVSLTDTYWIKPDNSKLNWNDVIKCTDYFSNLITNNMIDLYKDYSNERTFELTNVGSYEKCWKKMNDGWYMIKKQSVDEVESELIAYKICKLLNIPVAEYYAMKDKQLIMCKNFNDNWKYNFEDAYSVVGDEEDILFNIFALKNLNPNIVKEYTLMKILDCIIMNVDRHTHNYGILRDINSGNVIGLATMYDHNMCLKGNKSIMKDKSPKMFFDDVKECLTSIDKPLNLPKLREEDFNLSTDLSINKFMWNNYCEILKMINSYKRKD